LSNYLVTGSNRGIGLEFCKQLKHKGIYVIATCRESSKELNALGVEVIEDIDITSAKSISKLKNNLNGINIDCLINNAGVADYNSLYDLDRSSIRRQFEVNALSPLFFTTELLGSIKKGSKIAFITSRMGSIGDNSSGGSYGYRMSKVALSMAAKSLSIDLIKEEIYVAILHPGLVSSRMTGFTRNGISAKESVTGLLKVLDSLNENNTGTFWHTNGHILPW
tara:strand:- start:5867 stop:6532 length:666 start_codon:yes stop_codon:yes gene_type:complete